MKSILLLITLITMQIVVIEAHGQDDLPQLLEPEEAESSPERNLHMELLLGYCQGQEFLVGADDHFLTDTRRFGQLGVGVVIPIIEPSNLTTIWFKGSVLAGVGSGKIQDDGKRNIEGMYQIPAHLVFTYGGLRRKEHAWGVGAGIGIAPVIPQHYKEIFFPPSAIAEVIYAPGTKYTLRLQMDLGSSIIEEGTNVDLVYSSWSLQFVIGG